MKLSVIIIAYNEEQDIRQCLESVKQIADEIIVLDSGSQDNTVAIANEYTKNVFITDWPGYGKQKNRALAKATGDWVLSLDADERVTKQLQHEIQNIIKINQYSAYRIPRHSKYCGKFIKYGAWRNGHVMPLFQRKLGRFRELNIHETLLVKGPVGKLHHPIIHDSFKDLDEVLTKANNYSTAGAMMQVKAGKKSSLRKAIFHGLWTFIKDYFIYFGFLDGREGFMLAVSNAEGCYYKYLKIYYLTKSHHSQPAKPTPENVIAIK